MALNQNFATAFYKSFFFNMGCPSGPPLFDHLRSVFLFLNSIHINILTILLDGATRSRPFKSLLSSRRYCCIQIVCRYCCIQACHYCCIQLEVGGALIRLLFLQSSTPFCFFNRPHQSFCFCNRLV